jgi:hypothetical protein
MRYAGGVKTRAQSEESFRTRVLAYYDEFPGLGIWATMTRNGGECIGVHCSTTSRARPTSRSGTCCSRALAPRLRHRDVPDGAALRLRRAPPAADLRHHRPGQRRIAARAAEGRPDPQRRTQLPAPAYAEAGPLAWFERERESWLAEHT